MIRKFEKGKANELDQAITRRLKMRREMLGMNPKVVAEELGLTIQQIQKYENGKNRISAGNFQEFCDLQCEFSKQFEGYDKILSENKWINKIILSLAKIKNPEYHKALSIVVEGLTLREEKFK